MSVKICTGTKSRIPEIMTSEIRILDFNDDLKKQINKGLSDIDEANTTLHELMHCIAWLTNETNEGALANDTAEERVVNNFTNYLIGIFRENKWLLDYFKENFSDV